MFDKLMRCLQTYHYSQDWNVNVHPKQYKHVFQTDSHVDNLGKNLNICINILHANQSNIVFFTNDVIALSSLLHYLA